jgi:dienelactone hydrolase
MRAFLARPKKGKKFPTVIIIHENKGLVPHIQDVTKRMAKEGFLSLAPDALSPVGGTPEDISNVAALFKQLGSEQTTKNFVAAVKYLKRQSGMYRILLGWCYDKSGRSKLTGPECGSSILWKAAFRRGCG